MNREIMFSTETENSCRTLFKNEDNTYTVFIEKYDSTLEFIECSYDMNYGIFSEALNCMYWDGNFKGVYGNVDLREM